MTVDDFRTLLAQQAPNPSVHAVIVRERRTTGESPARIPQLMDEPAWPHGVAMGATPGVTLPDGRAAFLCMAPSNDMQTALANPEVADNFLGRTWQEACERAPNLSECIILVEHEQFTLDGKTMRHRTPLSAMAPGGGIHGYYVPYADSTDGHMTLPAGLEQAIPKPPIDPAPEIAEPLPTHHAFFISNCHVDTDGRKAVKLSDGVYWWAPQSYPLLASAAPELMKRDPEATQGRPLSGVVTVECGDNPTTEAHREDFRKALNKVRRLRALLNTLFARVPYIVAHYSAHRQPNVIGEMYGVLRDIQYRHYSEAFDFHHRRLSVPEIKEAAAFCFMHPLTPPFKAAVQRAAASIDLSREVSDNPMAIVLAWAGIESLISPGKEERELTTALALALVGLNAPMKDPHAFFQFVKSQYAVRSGVVHSFSVPTDNDARAALQFADRQTRLLVRAAVGAIAANKSRDQFGVELRARALSATV